MNDNKENGGTISLPKEDSLDMRYAYETNTER